MKKVYMKHSNDCYTACLATVLGLPYESVPRFFNDDDSLVAEWDETLTTFLDPLGYQIVTVDVGEGSCFLNGLKGYQIVAGLSYTPEHRERGNLHAVIYKDGKLYHDPKPDPAGVIVPEVVDLLVRINRGAVC